MRRVLLVFLALLAALEIAGCGAAFKLPYEVKTNAPLPTDKSYQMLSTWFSMDGARDILLTQGLGSQLYVLTNRGGIGTAVRGDVKSYPITGGLHGSPTVPTPLTGFHFDGLFSPIALCSANNLIYVLDQGDTCIARTPVGGATCNGGRVTDLSHYWRAHVYDLAGDSLPSVPPMTSSFTDTTMAYVNGIAADPAGNVYISGFAIVLVPDPLDNRIKERQFLPRVYKYVRGPRYPGIVPDDVNMPGGGWHRDTTWAVVDGDGRPQVQDPRGIVWSTVGGPALYVADAGKDAVKKITPDGTDAFFVISEDDVGVRLLDPTAVAVDLQGFIYVSDTGNQRVLRYDPTGTYVQKVNVEKDAAQRTLGNPLGIAADDSLVYVADQANGCVVRYQRRK